MRSVADLVRQAFELGAFQGGPYARIGDTIRPWFIGPSGEKKIVLEDGLETPLWIPVVWYAVLDELFPDQLLQRVKALEADRREACQLYLTALMPAEDSPRLFGEQRCPLVIRATRLDVEAVANAICAEANRMASGKKLGPRRKGKRKRQSGKENPPTDKQLEAVHIVGECKGNFADAGRRLGRNRKTVKQHYDAAMRKMGRAAIKHATQPLKPDKRGQADLAPEDDRRR